jgi:dihydrofolate reductase
MEDPMRRLLVWNVMTLDGYFEGPDPWSLDFHTLVWGDELEELSKQQLRNAGLLLFGRRTYEGMASYWTTAADENGEVADGMNGLPKAVISNTLTEATWNNTRLLTGDGVEAARALKAEEGKDIYVFGSAMLLASLLDAGLVDEYRICIAPALLGRGTPLFKAAQARIDLELIDGRPLSNGGILATYRPRAA